MRKLNRNLAGVLAGAIATFAFAGASQAQIVPTAVGSLVNLPYLTSAKSGDRVTVGTVTNTDPTTPYKLHITWISAADWSGIDFSCPLTPLETTYFVFEEGNFPGTAKVTFECSDQDSDLVFPDPDRTNNVFTRTITGADGLMLVSCEDITGPQSTPSTVACESLVGDATVLDFGQGTAWSVPGVHVQGVSVDADRVFVYDDAEFAAYPTALTTNYIAPDDDITAELLLYTPDGTVGGGPGVNAHLQGFAFDDDENATSASIKFDCFTLVALDDPLKAFGDNVDRDFGGHLVGHVQLFPFLAIRNDVHEFFMDADMIGDGNGVRRAPVHGWIVQSIAAGGNFDDGAFPKGGAFMVGKATWARQLGQSTDSLQPYKSDLAATVLEPFSNPLLP
jgi:hypothetical protein